MIFDTITVVGVGLLGGSIGLAAKKRRVAGRVIGVGRDRGKLVEAIERGIIDEATEDLEAATSKSNLILFCTPVDQIASQVISSAHAARPGTILTDVGSTKAEIVRSLENKLPIGITFVGSHPMAGSEKKGYLYSTADLFENRVTVLTPTDSTPADVIEKITTFWRSLGNRVFVMSPEEHDRAVAAISHLPHAVASALAGVTDLAFLNLAAGGFRDTTRIAAASSAIWEPIFRTNREAVLEATGRFLERMQEFQHLLMTDDAAGLIRWLNEGKKVRDALGS